jgi:hypothetical protein
MATDEPQPDDGGDGDKETLLRLIWKRDFERHRDIYDALEDE